MAHEVLNAIRIHRRAVSEAEQEFRQAADEMAEALIPYLRHVSYTNLARLKKRLRQFNAHRNVWKE